MDKKELKAAYKERKVIGGICAIKNNSNGKMLMEAVSDIGGFKNRFEFSKKTGSCVNSKLISDWNQFGSDSFSFEVIEELTKKATQTDKEFKEDIIMLKEIWLEKIDPAILY